MSTLQLQAYELMGQLSDNKLQLIVDIMKNFAPSAKSEHVMTMAKRIGIAKGKYTIPDDIDECNDEIAEMFGVNE